MEPKKPKELTREEIERRMELYRERVKETFQLDPTVEIKLGGNPYILEFDLRAVRDVYQDCAYNILKEGLTAEAEDDPKVFSAILYRGLQRHHPAFELTALDGLIRVRHLPYILSRLRLALTQFMPDMSDLEPTTTPEVLDEDPSLQPTVTG